MKNYKFKDITIIEVLTEENIRACKTTKDLYKNISHLNNSSACSIRFRVGSVNIGSIVDGVRACSMALKTYCEVSRVEDTVYIDYTESKDGIEIKKIASSETVWNEIENDLDFWHENENLTA